MKRSFRAASALSLLLALLVSGPAVAAPQANGPGVVVSVFGRAVVAGHETYVHVTVAGVSEEGANAGAVAELHRRGAVPVRSADYTKNGTWSQFKDSSTANDQVSIKWSTYGSPSLPNYIYSGGALSSAAAAWNDVETSSFAFSYGGTTSACPSLVDQCPGSQEYNGVNEAGWIDLGGVSNGSITLGITYFNFKTRGRFAPPQEADVALNDNAAVTWGSGGYDIPTVAAHELGHEAGLGHSGDSDALMYAWYQGARNPLLGTDDINGISALYPASDGGSGGTGDPGSLPGYCKKHPERAGCS